MSADETPLTIWGSGTVAPKSHRRQGVVLHTAGQWSRSAMALRRLHDATESFHPPADASWQPSFARLLPGDQTMIGHGDLGPWNIVAQGGIPVAFIDWEYAGAVDAIWELAEVAWLNAQLHDDDIADRVGLPPAYRRSRQVRPYGAR